MKFKKYVERVPLGAEGYWRIKVDRKFISLADGRSELIEKYGNREVIKEMLGDQATPSIIKLEDKNE